MSKKLPTSYLGLSRALRLGVALIKTFSFDLRDMGILDEGGRIEFGQIGASFLSDSFWIIGHKGMYIWSNNNAHDTFYIC